MPHYFLNDPGILLYENDFGLEQLPIGIVAFHLSNENAICKPIFNAVYNKLLHSASLICNRDTSKATLQCEWLKKDLFAYGLITF